MKELILNNWMMTKPAFGSAWHLLFFTFGMLISIVGAWLLRKTTDKQARWIVFFFGLALFFLELSDQLFWWKHLTPDKKYQWWLLPMQLCDMPIYMCLVFAFMKENKVKRAVYNCLATYNLFGGFVSIIERSGLSFEYLTLNINGYVSHILLVFLGMYLIASGRACRNWKDWLFGMAGFFGLVCIAQFVNCFFYFALKIELYLFYISPFKNTPIAVFTDIEKGIGWFWTSGLYLFALTLAAFVIFLVGCYGRKLYRLIVRKLPKIKKKKVE